jgi:uncharacterized protein (DUF2141 family)
MPVSPNCKIKCRRKGRLLAAGNFAVLISAVASLSLFDHAQTRASDKTSDRVTLSVTVKGFKNTKGQAIVALYSSRETWLKSEKALRLQEAKIGGPNVTIDFTDLGPGVYAVSAIHDENENGKLDMRYFPVPRPREGAGVSNDARKNVGPPSWNDAKFTLPATSYSITITLRY